MKLDLKGKLALDASALIERIHCDTLGRKLKGALESDRAETWTTKLAIASLKPFDVHVLFLEDEE